jgi:hypothetical protein
MKKTLLVISLLFLTFLITPKEASALTFKIPNFFSINFPKPTVKPSPTPKPSVSPSPTVSPQVKEIDVKAKYKMNTNTLTLDFENLDNVKSVNITFSYDSRAISHGVVDGFTPNGVKKLKKEFFLGTCSGLVCKSHPNAYNIKITITGSYTNNQPFTRNISIN